MFRAMAVLALPAGVAVAQHVTDPFQDGDGYTDLAVYSGKALCTAGGPPAVGVRHTGPIDLSQCKCHQGRSFTDGKPWAATVCIRKDYSAVEVGVFPGTSCSGAPFAKGNVESRDIAGMQRGTCVAAKVNSTLWSGTGAGRMEPSVSGAPGCFCEDMSSTMATTTPGGAFGGATILGAPNLTQAQAAAGALPSVGSLPQAFLPDDDVSDLAIYGNMGDCDAEKNKLEEFRHEGAIDLGQCKCHVGTRLATSEVMAGTACVRRDGTVEFSLFEGDACEGEPDHVGVLSVSDPELSSTGVCVAATVSTTLEGEALELRGAVRSELGAIPAKPCMCPGEEAALGAVDFGPRRAGATAAGLVAIVGAMAALA